MSEAYPEPIGQEEEYPIEVVVVEQSSLEYHMPESIDSAAIERAKLAGEEILTLNKLKKYLSETEEKK